VSYSEGLGVEDETPQGASSPLGAGLPLGVLPVSPTLVVDEIDSVVRLLQRHRARFAQVQSGELVEERLTPVVVEAVGEFLYASAKLESLARVLNGEGNG
jgi:hypothetical protein